MQKLLLLFGVIIGFVSVSAQNYSVYLIDTSLLKNANVVVRLDEDKYELKSLNRMVERHKKAVTVLNEEGDIYAGLYVHYDKLNELDFIEGTLYDANGKKIRSLKKSEIQDISGDDNMSLALDSRFKQHHFYHRIYPYTVEYEYGVTSKQTMFFPSWYTQTAPFYAVEESSCSITVPAAYQFRYKAFNYAGEPEITTVSDKKTYSWKVKKIPAVRQQFGFPGWRHISPMLITAPSDFQIDDYKGNLANWEEFGRFHLVLNQGRDVLPDAIKQQVHQLTAARQNNKEKVEALYEFLQKNTRYISIQLGIGGWQPFEASYVAKNRYGDCKALSNYMYSLLKEAGILSYYTIIKAGPNEEDIVSDFPSRQFNHVILCVPLKNDTLWLECTSQDQVPGYMGSFTGNRHAIIVTPEGGKLVRTPTYGVKENKQFTSVKALLDENGSLVVERSGKYTGIQQERYHNMMHNLSKDKVKEELNEYLIDLPTYEVLDFNYKQERTKIPVVYEQLKFSVSNYAQVSGKRIFINPNVSNRVSSKMAPDDRKYPIWINYAYADVDSVEITVPAGYKPEALPNAIQLESKFGKYQSEYKVENNKVFYYRKFERYSGFFEKELYNDLVKFYDQIYKGDRGRVVLVKSE